MVIFLYLLIGYLIGTLSPASLIGKRKHKDLHEHGTGNLGATNTMLVLGVKYGIAVMLFDMAKAFCAYKITAWLRPDVPWLAMAVGACVVIGHCFPFYMRGKGGKGLAAFGGLVLAYHPTLFLFLLVSGVVLMIAINYSFILPFYAAVFVTVYAAIREESLAVFLIIAAVSALIVAMHFGNFVKACRGQEIKIRAYIKSKLFRSGSAK